MAQTLTIGGKTRPIRFGSEDIGLAEHQIIKTNGRAILNVLGNHGALFTKHELDWLLWGAWRRELKGASFQSVLRTFYTEGGTLYDLQNAILEALLESGLYARRQEPTSENGGGADPGDPPAAGGSS